VRRFKVKVNDEVFEVEVEEVGGGEVRSVRPAAPIAPPAAPVAVPPVASRVAPVAPAAPKAPAAAPAPSAAPTAGGGGDDAIKAPIPGVVSGIKVSAGQSVKKGDVLLLLEAMKMQNEILAPFDATVTGIR